MDKIIKKKFKLPISEMVRVSSEIELNVVEDGGEHCQICGKEYGYVWSVSDELWRKATGIKNESGLRCIDCFSREARAKGIYIKWSGKENTK